MLTHPPTTDQTPVRSRRKPSTGAEAPLAPAATTQPEAVLTRRQARTRAYASEETRQDPAGRAHTPTGPPLDAFEAAARLFSFAPQQAAQSGSASALSFASNTDRALSPAHPQPHSRARALFLSVNFLGLVALLTIGMTVDAEALPHEHAEPATAPVDSSRSEDIQAYVTPGQTQAAPVITRDGYSTATLVDLAGTAGIMNYSSAVFTNNPDCAIQWPYAVGVPMTYGFGMRDGKMHEGTDFVPGVGAHIQAIAEGVVATSTDNGGAYGVTIVIDHRVDGQLVSTRYAHMEYDSRQVEVGDTVDVGQYIGRTGDTGRSFGAHLHFEVLLNGTTATDPLPWLEDYATC